MSEPNPIQVQKFLAGIDYPASKADIVRVAKDNGADNEVRSALEGIADREYDGPTDVTEEVAG